MNWAIHGPTFRTQRGATLIVALIFLVLLSLLGGSVAVNNSLQERMAGNTRQRHLAFQAAEHALKTANNALNDITSTESIYINSLLTGSAGTPPSHILSNGQSHANTPDYWKNTFNWTTSSSIAVTGISSQLAAANPRYTIEQMPSGACPEIPSKTCFYFRVTAHGVGKDSNAVAVVQSMYKYIDE